MDHARAAQLRFLRYFEAVKGAHERLLRRPLRDYKLLEPEGLEEAFRGILRMRRRGAPFVGELVHRLIWGQFLSNGNHRTTLAFTLAFLQSVGVKFPSYGSGARQRRRFSRDAQGYMVQSKQIVPYKSPGSGMGGVSRRRHRRITHEWVATMLGRQSGSLTNVGSQALRTFLS